MISMLHYTVKWDLSMSEVWKVKKLKINVPCKYWYWCRGLCARHQRKVRAFCIRYEAAVKGGFFGRQWRQRPLGEELWSLRQVKLEKRRREKMIEVHLKFFTLMFICVFFLEGEAWTAEVRANIPQQNRNAVKSVTQWVGFIIYIFLCMVGVSARANGCLSFYVALR